jgi:predicted RNA polymerase sigma factor
LTGAARTIAAIFRIELPKLVARLTRVVRDVGRAEELAQDAIRRSARAGDSRQALRVEDRPG